MKREKKETGEISAIGFISGDIGGALAFIITGATVVEYQLYAITLIFSLISIIFAGCVYAAFGAKRRKNI